jgi:hypothetical protein
MQNIDIVFLAMPKPFQGAVTSGASLGNNAS